MRGLGDSGQQSMTTGISWLDNILNYNLDPSQLFPSNSPLYPGGLLNPIVDASYQDGSVLPSISGPQFNPQTQGQIDTTTLLLLGGAALIVVLLITD